MTAQIIAFPSPPSPTLASMVLALQRDHLRATSWAERVFLFRVSSGIMIGSDAEQQWATQQRERVVGIWQRVQASRCA